VIAAIYARKSTDQSGVADEQKSVARQVEHARAYAARKGWRVLDEYVYIGDGISGAEFEKRPGFLRLMNTLKPRALPGLGARRTGRRGPWARDGAVGSRWP
jgi:DNA invertase Pin-like site-specific DNA recombinase